MIRILLLVISVSLSLDVYYVYPLCFFCLIFFNRKSSKLDILPLLLFVAVFIFLTGFLLKPDELFLPNPILTIIKYIVIIVILFYISFFTSNEDKKFFLQAFCISMIVNGLIIVYYSYFLSLTTNSYFGYGRLFNPIHNVETVSPKIALSMIAPLTAYCIFFKENRIVSLLLIGLSIYAFLFIQSRAALVLSVLLLLAFIYNFYKSFEKSKRIYCLVATVFSLAIGFSLYMLNSTGSDVDFSENRLVNSGLESKRFMHWQDGITKIVEYPFGGFSVDPNIEHVNYFHNIVIDSARIYGWLAISILVLIFLIQLFMIFRYQRCRSLTFLLVLSILNLIMMQDVVIEGNFLLFSLSIIISFLSSQRNIFGK